MESEFLNFSQPSSKFTNTFITASSNNIGLETFGVENTQNDKFRNFQLLFRDLMSVPLPKSTGQEMILDMVDSQYSLGMSKIQNLMNYDVALKLGNPTDYDKRVWLSYIQHITNAPQLTEPIQWQPYQVLTLSTPNFLNTTETALIYFGNSTIP